MTPKLVLFVVMAGFGILFVATWWAKVQEGRRRPTLPPEPDADLRLPDLSQSLIGFVTNFFDTLGVGSFATTTSLWRMRRMLDDRLIPGTLNVGHTVPTLAQAFIYIAVIKVDMRTLALMIAASVAGAWLGAGFVSGWQRRQVQFGMGIALLAAVLFLLLRLLKLLPPGGEALGLEGPMLALGLLGNFVLGALMTLGIGLYAPCMILVSLLGMNADTAFPIMMGSCAFLMCVGSVPFVRRGSYDLRAALGLTLAGLPAVFLAAFLVWQLPLDWVRWLVVVVASWTAISMLRAASSPGAAPANGKPA